MKKNFIYNVLYQMLILVLPLITMPYVSRILGAEGIGIYSYTYSIAYYFMITAMLGLNNYGNRTIAKVRDDKKLLSKEFCSIYLLQFFTSIIMITLYYIYMFVMNIEYRNIALIQSIYVISTMFDINWFFFGIENFKLTVTRNATLKILSAILIFIFVKKPNDIWIYTLILALSTLLSNIILIPFLKNKIIFVKVCYKDIIKHIKPNIMMFFPVIAVSIYKIMDKIMLGSMANVTEVGFYENAEKIIHVPMTLITALGTVMLPRVSNMVSKKQEDSIKNLLSKSMQFIMFLAFPMMCGIITVAREFSIIYFGATFLKTGKIIQLLSITIIFLSWGSVLRTQYIIPKEKDRIYIISAFAGAVVNFILNLYFIPKYESIGACFGTILAEFVVVLYQTVSIRDELPMIQYVFSVTNYFLKSIIMFVCLIILKQYMPDTIDFLIIQIIIGIIIYTFLNWKYIWNELQVKSFIMKKKENK